eukprot:4581336-Heterocapsa_arctica.AAC.1
MEYIIEEEDGISARVVLRQAGEVVHGFADASGYPPGQLLAELRAEVVETLMEDARSLRGGADDEGVVPMRRRVTGKRTAGKGKGKSCKGLTSLAQNMG